MKHKHVTRAITLTVLLLALVGIYSLGIGLLEAGTAGDSHLLAKIGVPGLGFIVAGAVVLTVLADIFLVKAVGQDLK